MSNLTILDSLLKNHTSAETPQALSGIYDYAYVISEIENVIAVVSDLCSGTSRIFCGAFAKRLGIDDYNEENSIWERKILSLMTEGEQERKIIAEIRFFHYIRHLGHARRYYYLMNKLRFKDRRGMTIDVLHRMYYVYNADYDSICYAICLYGPMPVDFKGNSIAVNSLTGIYEELATSSDAKILSNRELQVLALIDSGKKSKDIADSLNISVYTVCRHRQEILAKMQVKNSIEACRLAKNMRLI